MADVVVTIPISDISYKSWLNSSYIAESIRDSEGNSLIKQFELGPDQKDVFNDMIIEATREVLKLYVGRQGDVEGTAFEISTNNATYRFREGEPVLPHSDALKSSLAEDTKNAIYTYVSALWFKMKNTESQVSHLMDRYNKIANNIDINLYKLHD